MFIIMIKILVVGIKKFSNWNNVSLVLPSAGVLTNNKLYIFFFFNIIEKKNIVNTVIRLYNILV